MHPFYRRASEAHRTHPRHMPVNARAGTPSRSPNFKGLEGGSKDGGGLNEQRKGRDSR